MAGKDYEYRFREPFGPPTSRGAATPEYSRGTEAGMIVERNVPVRMRDGVKIYADVMRPLEERPVPPIICWTPYGKHRNGVAICYAPYPGCDVKPDQVSQYATFEGADPSYWVPKGYAVVNVDIRGTYYSQGKATYVSPEEAQDFYDLIEWAGVQPWSNGKVGLSGVSYLAVAQWRAAELQPPHLAAINPWEGWTDTYREVALHGGIPETWFWDTILASAWGCGTTQVEDLVKERAEHLFFDAFWKSKAADFSKIKVPAFVVACWADQGLHTRGTLEGFKRIASEQKWLEVHGRKKWAYYHAQDSRERLREFFDHFLKGTSSSVLKWPKVRLEVREAHCVGDILAENEWPIARTRYRRLHLDAVRRTLQPELPKQAGTCRYHSLGGGPGAHRAQFEIAFDARTDLIGHMKLKLWAEAPAADDMDLFVGVYKFDARGNFVPLPFMGFFSDGPVALGWLRASHRELDPERSSEYQPVLAHQRELRLKPGEIVPLEIELWPSGTRFEAGERLRLVIQGTDLQKYSKKNGRLYYRHEYSVNSGQHIIHTGGKHDSHLLVPVVPPR